MYWGWLINLSDVGSTLRPFALYNLPWYVACHTPSNPEVLPAPCIKVVKSTEGLMYS